MEILQSEYARAAQIVVENRSGNVWIGYFRTSMARLFCSFDLWRENLFEQGTA